MNFRKVLALGVVIALATCDTLVSKGIACQHYKEPIAQLFVGEASIPKQPSTNAHNHQVAKPAENFVTSSSSVSIVSNKPDQNSQQTQKIVTSQVKHVHTQSNAPGAKSLKKTLWSEVNGDHQTTQSYDKNGKVHQVHKWKDAKGRKHQTDQWNDDDENVHQCHRFEDDDGCVHQAIQVTSAGGKVTNEHFKKDKDGKILRVQLGSVDKVPSLIKEYKPLVQENKQLGQILHAPGCPNLKKTN